MKQIVSQAPTADIVSLTTMTNEYLIQFIVDGGVVAMVYKGTVMVLMARCDSQGRWGFREPLSSDTYAWNSVSNFPKESIEMNLKTGVKGMYLFDTHQEFFSEAAKNKWK